MYRTCRNACVTIIGIACTVLAGLSIPGASARPTLAPMTTQTGQTHCKDEAHLHVVVATDVLETPSPVTVTYQAVMPCKNILGGTAAGIVISKKPGKPFDGMHVLASAVPWLEQELAVAAFEAVADGQGATVSIQHPEHGDFSTFLTLDAAKTAALVKQLKACWGAES